MRRLLTTYAFLCTMLAVARLTFAAGADYDGSLADFRALLAKLVAADTTNPPGNEARAVTIVAARLDAERIPYEVTEFAPGRQNLVARLSGTGGEKPLLLLAHLDVVGAEGQPWTSPPHEVTERDGFLVGRGVSDDLGMALMELETMVMLKRSGTRLRRDVVLALTGDEESGGAGVRWLLANRPQSLQAELAFNEGGGVRLGDDGKVSFVGLQVAEKTYQDFRITAKGTSGHSSVPNPDNAIYRLARGIERLGAHRFPARLLPVTRAYFRARAAVEPPRLAAALRTAADSKGAIPPAALATIETNPVLGAALRTTCVATMVSGGTRANALPAEAQATVNCRIIPDETIDDVAHGLADVIADPDISIERLEPFGSGPASDVEGAAPAAVRKIATEMWPAAPVIPILSLGGTDSRFLRARGIATYGLSPIALTEADARRAHGVDERIPIASLRPGLEFLHRLVLELAAAR
jgi:acetylornithine deacetylase/succinyl-diaminopimelate desuccinylase-like protein